MCFGVCGYTYMGCVYADEKTTTGAVPFDTEFLTGLELVT